jgi:hypothetical protein
MMKSTIALNPQGERDPVACIPVQSITAPRHSGFARVSGVTRTL